MESVVEVIGNALQTMAEKISASTGCAWFWGEPEMPVSLKEGGG